MFSSVGRPVLCPSCESINIVETPTSDPLETVEPGEYSESIIESWLPISNAKVSDVTCSVCGDAYTVRVSPLHDSNQLFCINTRAEITGGGWLNIPFWGEKIYEVALTARVRKGSAVDFYIVSMDEYVHFNEGERFISEYSEEDSIEVDMTMQSGSGEKYMLLISKRGAPIDANSKVDFRFEGILDVAHDRF